MQPATWPRAHDVQGWKCNNAECGEWRDFADSFEGESHECEVPAEECWNCDGRGGWNPERNDCTVCHGAMEVPAKGVFTEAFA